MPIGMNKVSRSSKKPIVIPDSGDLHVRYDATELGLNDQDTVSAWPDETGNNHDLSATNSPTYLTSQLNGNPVVRTDDTDYFTTSFSGVAQPYSSFIVAKLRSSGNSTYENLHDGGGSDEFRFAQRNDNSWSANYHGGGETSGSATDGDWHIFSEFVDGSSSAVYKDGTLDSEPPGGAGDLTGLSLAARPGGINGGPYDIAEWLVYPQDKRSSQSEIESYLNDKWAVF